MENLEVEIWKDVLGYEDSYRISNLGNIESKYKPVKSSNNSTAYKKAYKIKHIKNKYGYNIISLCNKNVKKTVLVHRLLALHFIPNPENKPFINHIDGIKDNNILNNLEWCTHQENMIHSFNVLKRKPSIEKINLKIILDLNTGVFYRSCKELCNLYGFEIDKTRRMLSGRYKNNTQFIYA